MVSSLKINGENILMIFGKLVADKSHKDWVAFRNTGKHTEEGKKGGPPSLHEYRLPPLELLLHCIHTTCIIKTP